MAKINYGEELGWELDVDFPSWANTEIYVKTISKGYLLEGEKPKDAYWRVATRVAQRLNKPQLATEISVVGNSRKYNESYSICFASSSTLSRRSWLSPPKKTGLL